MGETCITDYPTKSTDMNKYDKLNYKMLDINKLFETIILDRNPKTKILSNSSNNGMLRFANITLAL